MNTAAVQETARLVQAGGGNAWAYTLDVTVPDACTALAARVNAEVGAIDILVNNAGIIIREGTDSENAAANWKKTIDVNVHGTFNVSLAWLPAIQSTRGSIINIASVVGIMGNIGQANYAAAKAGVIGLTKACAKELAARNIRVNAVAPGFIATDMTDAIPEKNKEAMLTAIPLGRMGLAEDVAKAVSFLASDDASYITGQVLKVDGGMVM